MALTSNFYFATIPLSLVLLILSSDRAVAQNDSNSLFSKASCEFALDLLKTASKVGNENVVMSPISIGVLMAVLQQGARQNTLTQFDNLLHMTSEQSKNEYHSALQLLQAEKGNVDLEWGNKAYVRPGFQVKDDFNKTASDYFGAPIVELDFVNPSTQAAADKMNKWIEETTRGIIKNFVPSNFLSSDTVLVLLNAIYFKGKWNVPFEKRITHSKKFEKTPQESVNVPFMSRTERLTAGEDWNAGIQWVDLPFKEKKFSMLFVLPRKKHDLAQVMDKMNSELLRSIINDKAAKNVIMEIPKFKLSRKVLLNSVLRELGLTDVFGSQSNLEGIVSGSLPVSQVLHQADVEIDEEGSVAAAATGVFSSVTSFGPSDDLTFVADHPFLFFIVDKVNKVPLFMGKVVDPTS